MPRDEYDDLRPRDDEFDPGFDPPPRRPRLPTRRRSNAIWWMFGGCGCFLLVLLAGCGGLIWWVLSPTNFPEQTEDFADAHKAFRTKLTLSGASPQPHHPLTPPADVDVVEYKSGDLTLTAWVSKPSRGGGKQPGILYLHSGFAFGEDDWEETEPLRKAGFTVLIPMLRGENGLPGNYSLFCDEVNDARAAADVLAKRPDVDSNRLFVAGYSSGGTLAMLTAMADKRFKGCASISGVPDMQKIVTFEAEAFTIPFDTADPKEVVIRSPLAWPKSFKCPARLYVGSEELPYLWATQKLAKKAKANGQDVECVDLEGDHSTVVRPALDRMIQFFNDRK